MKRSVLSFLALSVAALPAMADTSQVYNLTGFDELDVAAGVDVKFTRAAEYSVKADFEKGSPEDVKVKLSDDRLYLSLKSNTGWGKKVRVTFYVTAPQLEEIEASSGSSLLAEGLASEDVELNVSSGASVSMYGTCSTLKIKATSGGAANAKGLTCETVKATANSGGAIGAHASSSATSKTSSGGSVDIYGNPPSRSANKSISGGSTDFHDS
mgnify:FL=1